jgi:hypothetical protein
MQQDCSRWVHVATPILHPLLCVTRWQSIRRSRTALRRGGDEARPGVSRHHGCREVDDIVIHRNQRRVQFGWHSQIANPDLQRNLKYSCQSLIVKRRRLILMESSSSAIAIMEGAMLPRCTARKFFGRVLRALACNFRAVSFSKAAVHPCSRQTSPCL